MTYRFMRVIVFFDLPTVTMEERREYAKFRKYLIKSGFVMMQESVYSKLAQNAAVADSVINNVKKNKPPVGLVQLISITEKQFQKMEYIIGTSNSVVLDSDDRLVIL